METVFVDAIFNAGQTLNFFVISKWNAALKRRHTVILVPGAPAVHLVDPVGLGEVGIDPLVVGIHAAALILIAAPETEAAVEVAADVAGLDPVEAMLEQLLLAPGLTVLPALASPEILTSKHLRIRIEAKKLLHEILMDHAGNDLSGDVINAPASIEVTLKGLIIALWIAVQGHVFSTSENSKMSF